MTSHNRRQSLIRLLQKQPGMRIPELADSLGVSNGTIRNDLDYLEKEGTLKRVHGGAILSGQTLQSDTSFDRRYHENPGYKSVIARKAAELVDDGTSLLLDASTTVYYLAQQLADRQRLRVVTNGIDVARLMARNSSNLVVLIGGIVTSDGSSVTGSLSEQIIRDLHIQMAFVSCSGLSLTRGLTDVLLAEAELKGKAIASAQAVYALVDSSKIGKEDLTPFAGLDQISQLYTDNDISAEWMARLTDAGLHYTICSAA
jgi:DeoR family transcriptional regulator, fructose operon transcriptional repressor